MNDSQAPIAVNAVRMRPVKRVLMVNVAALVGATAVLPLIDIVTNDSYAAPILISRIALYGLSGALSAYVFFQVARTKRRMREFRAALDADGQARFDERLRLAEASAERLIGGHWLVPVAITGLGLVLIGMWLMVFVIAGPRP